ncbi:hypothetical protein SCALM49S_06776 [Streptomyces californicus]
MQTGLRITAFAAGLAAAFGSAYAVGGALEPADAPKKPAHQDAHGEKERPAAGKGEAEDLPGGLAVSRDGFTLDLDTPRVEAGEPAELRFSVVDEDTSRKVTAFRREHGRELHLIVASGDLATYRHLHPVRAADGTWSAPVELPEAGGYRVFADFTPDVKNAEGVTLGADLAAAGDARPEPLPDTGRTVTVDGYEVTLDGALRPGAGTEITMEVEGRQAGHRPPAAPRRVRPPRRTPRRRPRVPPRPSERRARRRPDEAGPRDLLHRDGPDQGRLPPLPRLPARGQGPHRRVHRARRGASPEASVPGSGETPGHGH